MENAGNCLDQLSAQARKANRCWFSNMTTDTVVCRAKNIRAGVANDERLFRGNINSMK